MRYKDPNKTRVFTFGTRSLSGNRQSEPYTGPDLGSSKTSLFVEGGSFRKGGRVDQYLPTPGSSLVHGYWIAVAVEFNETCLRDPEEAEHTVRARNPELEDPARALRYEPEPADMFGELCLQLCNRSMEPPAPLDQDHGRVCRRMDHEVAVTIAFSPAECHKPPGPCDRQRDIERLSRRSPPAHALLLSRFGDISGPPARGTGGRSSRLTDREWILTLYRCRLTFRTTIRTTSSRKFRIPFLTACGIRKRGISGWTMAARRGITNTSAVPARSSPDPAARSSSLSGLITGQYDRQTRRSYRSSSPEFLLWIQKPDRSNPGNFYCCMWCVCYQLHHGQTGQRFPRPARCPQGAAITAGEMLQDDPRAAYLC